MSELAVHIPEVRRANKAEAAQFFDVTLPTLDKWIRDGMPVVQRGARGVSWVLDLLQAAEWRFSPRTPDGGVDPESMTPAERKLWYDGETRRRDLQERDRELLQAREVEETVSRAYSAITHGMLSLPDNLERRASMTPEQLDVCELIIHEKLNELAVSLSSLAPLAEG